MTQYTVETSWQETVLLALLAIVVGVVVAYASLGFLLAIGWINDILIGQDTRTSLYTALAGLSAVYLFIIPVIGALVVNLLMTYGMNVPKSHGPADVIYAARQGNGEMSIKDGVTNAFASIVSIGSGASVGRYGPVVHLGATLGSWLAKKMRLEPARRSTLLACGVAGAISASFSAPLAGVVFAHEVVVGRFGVKSVMPIVISSVVATTVARYYEINVTLFNLSDLFVVADWEYCIFALLGAIGGGLAILYMALMRTFIRIGSYLPGSPVIRAILGGSLLGAIIVVFPQTFGLGEQVVHDVLMLNYTVGAILILLVAKLLATSVSFAAGFAGGVFGPALFIGALLGTAVGLSINELADVVSSPAVYGVAGMGAVISRVVGAPIATILIVFELTQDYYLTTAVMVAVVVGNTVTQRLFNRSYFFYQLRERGVEPDEPRAYQFLRQLPVNQLVKEKKMVTVLAGTRVSSVRHVIVKAKTFEIYVIDDNGCLLGQVNSKILMALSDEKTLSEPVTNYIFWPSVVLYTQMNVLDVFMQLKKFAGVSVPVVRDKTSCYLVGVVYERSVLRMYQKAVEQTQQDER